MRKSSKPVRSLIAAVALVTVSTGALAQNFMKDKAEVEKLLTGATFIGVYLRTESAYTLQFGTDGTLTDTTGAKRAGGWTSRRAIAANGSTASSRATPAA